MTPLLPERSPGNSTPTESSALEAAAARPYPPWAERVTSLLDDCIRVPGTNVRFGLDALLGFLLPGAGDALTGVGSATLLVLAFRMRLPRVAIARMAINIAVDALVGSVPIIGDLFDVSWKANRRNLILIQRYQHAPRSRASAGDYAVVAFALAACMLAIVLPIVIVLLTARGLVSLFGGS